MQETDECIWKAALAKANWTQ